MITICLHGDKLTTADLEWFRGAVDAASGHSGSDYPIEITDGMISVEIPGEEDEDAEADDSPLKVGDRVRVTEDWHPNRIVPIVGRIGTLTKIDPDDEDGRHFEVRWGAATYDINWAKSVERATS